MASSGSALRVLVVDDDPQVRKVLVDLLRLDGHEADPADGARAAMSLLLKRRYAIIITDLEMPETSGLELVQEVRGRGLLLPVLILSGDLNPDLEGEAKKFGRVECLPKPFHIDGVRAAIERLLPSKGPDRPSAFKMRQHDPQ